MAKSLLSKLKLPTSKALSQQAGLSRSSTTLPISRKLCKRRLPMSKLNIKKNLATIKKNLATIKKKLATIKRPPSIKRNNRTTMTLSKINMRKLSNSEV
jgi:hypothetical protein